MLRAGVENGDLGKDISKQSVNLNSVFLKSLSL